MTRHNPSFIVFTSQREFEPELRFYRGGRLLSLPPNSEPQKSESSDYLDLEVVTIYAEAPALVFIRDRDWRLRAILAQTLSARTVVTNLIP